MTPLEKACQVFWDQVFWDEAGISLRRWDETGDTIKGDIRAAMQKTLLALAECDLPEGMLDYLPKFYSRQQAFSNVLRSIANEGKDNA